MTIPLEEGNGEFRVIPDANGEFSVLPEANGELEAVSVGPELADVAKSSVVEAELVSTSPVWLLEKRPPVKVRAFSGLSQSPFVPLVDAENS